MTLKLFNVKSKEDLITNLDSIFTKDSLSPFIDQLCSIAENQTSYNGETVNKTLDGELLNVSIRLNVVPGYEKDYSRVLISLMDITGQKKAEEGLRLGRERLKLLNQIIRHDLSNDFIVIKSAVNIFRRSSETKMIDEIERRADKSLETIDTYRKYESFIDSNADLDKIETCDLINELITEFPKIKFKIEGKCNVFADNALNSIFTNLVTNSIKHGKASAIDIKISTENNMSEIKFADNGTGIPDKIKNKIFNEGFFYGKAGHTGIGLHIVKKTIERYGGTITVEDNTPSGTVFIISLRQAL
jgi:signal transduction histidine kinase